MLPTHIVVGGYRATDECNDNLQDDAWNLALDQRAFGPRQLVVALAEPDGRLVGLAHTPRLKVPELALGPCIQHIGAGPTLAIAYCDELIDQDRLPDDLPQRLFTAKAVASEHGVHLIDWFACDDDCFRSSRLALGASADEWWDAP